jgi:PAS domain S-box-containing protein
VATAIGFYAPEARPAIEAAVAACIADGTPFDLELPLVTATGALRWVRSVGEPDRDADGICRIHGAIQDITDRREAAREIAESRERFMLAIRGSHDGIWDWDLTTNEVFYSTRWMAMLGYADGELPAELGTFQALLHPEERDWVLFELERYLSGARPTWSAEIRLRHRDGSWVWVLTRGEALRDAHGRPYRMAGSHVDISSRKAAEAERERLQAQLVQAQKMESIGRLAGGVAHDFNNMLAVIQGHVELALDRVGEGAELRADLEQIRDAARRSADLTRQLLGFSRQQVVAPRLVDVNDTVGGVVRLLRSLIGEDMVLDWRPDAEAPVVRIDPAQLDQLVVNLVLNARDAVSGAGAVRVTSGAGLIADEEAATMPGAIPGRCLVLEIADDGPGMSPELQARIFEPFFTTKPVGEGTGLGLATVYGIVRQNGGMVTVHSQPGAGTAFRVRLPAAQDVAPSPSAAETTADLPRAVGTVLLAEDEPSIVRLCEQLLRRLGCHVLVGGTPEAALALARTYSGHIDLLLTDVVMPGMNGRELARAVAQARPGIRTLFMSGYPADVIAQRDLLEPNDVVLTKPFTRAELAAAVSATLASPLGAPRAA